MLRSNSLAIRVRWVIAARKGRAQVAQRVGVGPGGSWRPGVRVIAKQFGVDPVTVQRISRPFAATLFGNLSFPDVSAHTQRIQDRGSASTMVGLASNSPPACGPAGYLNGMRPGSELGRQVAVDFESDTDFLECGSCPIHSCLPTMRPTGLSNRAGSAR